MDALAKLVEKMRLNPVEVGEIRAALGRCQRAGGDWAAELRATGKARWTALEIVTAAMFAEMKAKASEPKG